MTPPKPDEPYPPPVVPLPPTRKALPIFSWRVHSRRSHVQSVSSNRVPSPQRSTVSVCLAVRSRSLGSPPVFWEIASDCA